MAMNMVRAFNSRMMIKLFKISVADGYYNDTNDWIEGETTKSTIHGVLTSGNKFAQFDKGTSLNNTDGGVRYPKYKSLYVPDKYALEMGDKIEYNEEYYNVLQQTDERSFGFRGYILEKSEEWTP